MPMGAAAVDGVERNTKKAEHELRQVKERYATGRRDYADAELVIHLDQP